MSKCIDNVFKIYHCFMILKKCIKIFKGKLKYVEETKPPKFPLNCAYGNGTLPNRQRVLSTVFKNTSPRHLSIYHRVNVFGFNVVSYT